MTHTLPTLQRTHSSKYAILPKQQMLFKKPHLLPYNSIYISVYSPNIYSNTNPECALKFVSILLEIYKPFFDIEDIDELTDPAIEWMFKLMDEYFNQTEENPFTINVQDELLDEFNKERDRLSNYFAQFEGSSEYEDSDIL